MSRHAPSSRRREGSLLLWIALMVALLALACMRRWQPVPLAASVSRLALRLRLERLCHGALLWEAVHPRSNLDLSCSLTPPRTRVHLRRLPCPCQSPCPCGVAAAVVARSESRGHTTVAVASTGARLRVLFPSDLSDTEAVDGWHEGLVRYWESCAEWAPRGPRERAARVGRLLRAKGLAVADRDLAEGARTWAMKVAPSRPMR